MNGEIELLKNGSGSNENNENSNDEIDDDKTISDLDDYSGHFLISYLSTFEWSITTVAGVILGGNSSLLNIHISTIIE